MLLAKANQTLEGTAYARRAFARLAAKEREALVTDFRDESGHRRPVDGAFLRALMGLPSGPVPEGSALDIVLWSNIGNEAFRPLDCIASRDGPLNVEGSAAIEVWTELELCCVQALWSHAVARRSQAAASRALGAAKWLEANIQPDNATNRPWGIGVFVERGQIDPGPSEADLYAETLLHNCTVARGKPDLLSSLIMLEACGTLAVLEEARRANSPWFEPGA